MTEPELARCIWRAIIVCHVASPTGRIRFRDIVRQSELLPDITEDIIRGHVADFVQGNMLECVGPDIYALALQHSVDEHPAGGGPA